VIGRAKARKSLPAFVRGKGQRPARGSKERVPGQMVKEPSGGDLRLAAAVDQDAVTVLQTEARVKWAEERKVRDVGKGRRRESRKKSFAKGSAVQVHSERAEV